MTEDGALRLDGLWQQIVRRSERAARSGALETIATDYQIVPDGGVRFLVRIVSNLARKAAARQRPDPLVVPGGRDFNPFLPYDDELFVTNVGPRHVCLLNKYNVVDHHVLVVTRAFEQQEALLSLGDFEALLPCLDAYRSLGFYNGGEMAGASQRHKHLQIVPLPLGVEGPAVPIEPLLAAAPQDGRTGQAPGLPFAHGYARFAARPASPRARASRAARALGSYHALLRQLGLIPRGGARPSRARGPYNLLCTGEWMLVAPRVRECLERISVNALGFAGALLVRNAAELALVRSRGPMAVLTHVAGPTPFTPSTTGEGGRRHGRRSPDRSDE